jgi:hypothetical protein
MKQTLVNVWEFATWKDVLQCTAMALGIVLGFFLVGSTILHMLGEVLFGDRTLGLWMYGNWGTPNWGFNFMDAFGVELKGDPGFFTCAAHQC